MSRALRADVPIRVDIHSRRKHSVYFVPLMPYSTSNICVTLKSGLLRGSSRSLKMVWPWNWCHSKAWVRFPIRFLGLYNYVVGTGKYDHITPALRDVLHWLPVRQRTEFKIAVLAFDCVRGTDPDAYFKDVCVPVSDIAARSSLRSVERGDLFNCS